MEISVGRATVDTKPPISQNVTSCRNTTKRFHLSQNKSAISRDNQMMLGKLIDISKRKYNKTFGASHPLPKTLNERNRREDNRRIIAENQELARRLVARAPVVSSKELNDQFADMDRYRNNISKVRNVHRGRMLLPPLD